MDIASEPESIRALYGVGEEDLLRNNALRTAAGQRGVRFVQLFHTGWDHHGGKGKQNLIGDLGDVRTDRSPRRRLVMI